MIQYPIKQCVSIEIFQISLFDVLFVFYKDSCQLIYLPSYITFIT